MSAPNASSSSSQLVSYAQDIDYTRTEGFKQFKARYNVRNARAARNDPNSVYPSAETIYQAVVAYENNLSDICTNHNNIQSPEPGREWKIREVR